MNIIKHTIFMIAILGYSLSSLQAGVIPYKEDAYLQQADEEWIELAEKAAALTEFNKNYEVVSPKKAGLEINPWNRFTGQAINPTTKNYFVLINPEWFKKLTPAQQQYFFVKSFIGWQKGQASPYQTYITYLFIALSILTFILLLMILAYTSLNTYSIWIRIIIAFVGTILLEFIILDPLELRMKAYFNKQHEQNLIRLVIEKTHNKEAAIQALEAYDSAIKNEIKNGESSLAPFANRFQEAAEWLMQS